jgi:hypothetical protein
LKIGDFSVDGGEVRSDMLREPLGLDVVAAFVVEQSSLLRD